MISYLETTTNETLGGVQGVVGVSDRLALRHEADQSSAIRLRSGAETRDERREKGGQGRRAEAGRSTSERHLAYHKTLRVHQQSWRQSTNKQLL